MAGYQNSIAKLVDKIEWRLGLVPLTKHLPEEYGKDAWAKIIKEDTLLTYSRYLPRKFPMKVTQQTAPKKDGWYYIDEDQFGGLPILGVGDVDWSTFGLRSLGLSQASAYGATNMAVASNFNVNDIFEYSIRANYASMFSNTIIPEFEAPNRFRLVTNANQSVEFGDFHINVFLPHLESLVSIPPTAMETFEQLAQADIASFLANNLRYWDGYETAFGAIDLKLDNLQNEAGKRDQVIEYLQQNYVSAANKAMPLMMTV